MSLNSNACYTILCSSKVTKRFGLEGFDATLGTEFYLHTALEGATPQLPLASSQPRPHHHLLTAFSLCNTTNVNAILCRVYS